MITETCANFIIFISTLLPLKLPFVPFSAAGYSRLTGSCPASKAPFALVGTIVDAEPIPVNKIKMMTCQSTDKSHVKPRQTYFFKYWHAPWQQEPCPQSELIPHESPIRLQHTCQGGG